MLVELKRPSFRYLAIGCITAVLCASLYSCMYETAEEDGAMYDRAMYSRGDEPLELFFNGWFSEVGKTKYAPAEFISADTEYLFSLDLSSVKYIGSGGLATAPASDAIEKELENLLLNPDYEYIELEIVAIPDSSVFDLRGAELVRKMRITKDALFEAVLSGLDGPYDKDVLIDDVAVLGSESPFILHGVEFELRTRDQIETEFASIAFSIWIPGKYPIAEFQMSYCTERTRGCSAEASLRSTSSGIDALRIAQTASVTEPDAAIQFFEFSGEKTYGLLRINGSNKFDDSDACIKSRINYERGFVAWRIDSSAADLLTSLNRLAERMSTQSVTDHLMQLRGQDIQNLFFPPGTRDNQICARDMLHRFVMNRASMVEPFSNDDESGGDPPSVFVRMQTDGAGSALLPFSMMAFKPETSGDNVFLGAYFRVASPLSKQDYSAPQQCIDSWTMAVPYSSGPTLMAATRYIRQNWPYLGTTNLEKICLTSNQAHCTSNILPWLQPPASDSAYDGSNSLRDWLQFNTNSNPQLLSVVSHHADNALYFKEGDEFFWTSIEGRMPDGSILVLNGCATGSSEPTSSAILDKLNENGISAAIVTSRTVSASLADAFGKCFFTTASSISGNGEPIGLVFHKTINCLSKENINTAWDTDTTTNSTEGGSSIVAGPRALWYNLVGNQGLLLCPPN